MWYIFDQNFTLQGVMDSYIQIEIEHNFYEADNLTFTTDYSPELYAIMKLGNILYRKNQTKGWMIHTIEINETDKTIIGMCYDLKGLLDMRVVSKPIGITASPELVMHSLVMTNLQNPTDANRKIPNMTLKSNNIAGAQIEVDYYGETIYSIISELSKSYGIGYRFNYDPAAKNIQFETFAGTDRTINQSAVEPVRWSHKWNDTRDEMILTSQKDYKNVVYAVTGDETGPISLTTGSGSGWNRFEMFDQATDITKGMQDENGVTLTNTQVTNLLKSRSNLDLYRNFKLNNYTFVLNNDLAQVFGVDYCVGDLVSVIHEGYGIIKHERIVKVKETIIQEKSQFEIEFDE
jgi:hypothetical protein